MCSVYLDMKVVASRWGVPISRTFQGHVVSLLYRECRHDLKADLFGGICAGERCETDGLAHMEGYKQKKGQKDKATKQMVIMSH